MRRIVLSLIVSITVIFLASCARGISPEQAANGRAKCGRSYVR
ncbi:MAG TPA: hypothetical protein VK489_06215 [Ferruginibacter sp.]|nr:hypothetical protein [Ferruginibacter sp.]